MWASNRHGAIYGSADPIIARISCKIFDHSESISENKNAKMRRWLLKIQSHVRTTQICV